MNAYNELYLSDAMQNMGEMMEYAAIACGLDMNDFFTRFRISGYSSEWEVGNPAFISGMSGTELCRRTLEKTSDRKSGFPDALVFYDAGEEYWCGWIMAYLQWRLNMPFVSILKAFDFNDMLRLYPAMHTASEERCAAYVIDRLQQMKPFNRLQFYRQKLGLTQRELSDLSGVNLRTLQQYEAGSKDLNKASAGSVIRLSQVLGRTPAELLNASVV